MSKYSIQKCLAPIHFMQLFLGTLRVSLRDSQVDVVTTGQNVYLIFVLVIMIISVHDLNIDYYERFSESVVLYLCFGSAISIFTICAFLHFINAHFVNKVENVKLYITLQSIDHMISRNGNSYSSAKHYLVNIISVYGVECLYVIGFSLQYYLVMGKGYVSPTCVVGGTAMFSLHLEMHMLGNLVYYLVERMLALRKDFELFLLKVFDTTKIRASLDNDVNKLSHSDCIRMKNIVFCLNTIIRAYNSVGKLYRFQIFLETASIVLWTFPIIQATYEGVRHGFLPMSVAVLILVIVLFEFFQVILVVLICKNFEKQVKDLRSVCFVVMIETSERAKDALRNMVKRMLRITEKEERYISVYDIFTVDLSLPLHLLVLIANYVIVLMQFTLI